MRDAYGVFYDANVVKPPTDGKGILTPHPGYDDLVEEFAYCLYFVSVGQCGHSDAAVGQLNKTIGKAIFGDAGDARPAPDDTLTLKATMNRAFLRAFTRTMTDKDMKTFEPVFRQERAGYRRMIEMLEKLDSLKNIKP